MSCYPQYNPYGPCIPLDCTNICPTGPTGETGPMGKYSGATRYVYDTYPDGRAKYIFNSSNFPLNGIILNMEHHLTLQVIHLK